MEKSNLKVEEVNKNELNTTNDMNKSQEDKVTEKKEKKNKKNIIPIIIIGIVFAILVIFSTIFAIININNTKIVSGVKIEGIDVSGLSKEEAKSKIDLAYNEKKQKDILLKYEDYEVTISPELLETNYDTEKAIEEAILVGKNSNIIVNNYNILFALIGRKNINVNMTINEEETNKSIEDIGSKIPGAVTEPDYYIEGDKLIITKGKEGLAVDTNNLIEKIKDVLKNINSNQQYIDIPVISKNPEQIDIDKIHEEVYKEVQDAYYTKEPFTIHPEVEGVDFNVEEAKAMLQEDKEQYEIKLTITKPKVTTSQIGSEAFPDLLATYSTRYDGGNISRTTNLRIACQKINDKVILPGETFSYNKTLGERTAAAGYKYAKVYENGEVVDGIGGGICQISSTLYNAAMFANLNITTRYNHQFLTSYVAPGRDATVVYGVKDLKFINNRSYPIKIEMKISNGIVYCSFYGIKENTEYDVSFDTQTVSVTEPEVKYEYDNSLSHAEQKIKQSGAQGMTVNVYKVTKLDGTIISKELISQDIYNSLEKIVVKGQ